MDGKELLYKLREFLNEQDDSPNFEEKTAYDALYEAVVELVDRAELLTSVQTITTVADQTDYTLNADYIKPLLRNPDNDELFLYYTNSSGNDSLMKWKDYRKIKWENNTDSVDIPSNWTIMDDRTKDDLVTGTSTATNTLANDVAVLDDSAGDFSDVSAGDTVHNTSDSSDGIVLKKISSIKLNVALFSGTNNYFTSSDAYVIQPQGRYKLVLNPPPSNGSETISFEYIKRPDPVYTDYGFYRIPQHFMVPLIRYAAYFFAYRDLNPQLGNAFYDYFSSYLKRVVNTDRQAKNRGVVTVSLKH